jgi:hypothetical protein
MGSLGTLENKASRTGFCCRRGDHLEGVSWRESQGLRADEVSTSPDTGCSSPRLQGALQSQWFTGSHSGFSGQDILGSSSCFCQPLPLRQSFPLHKCARERKWGLKQSCHQEGCHFMLVWSLIPHWLDDQGSSLCCQMYLETSWPGLWEAKDRAR